MCQPLSAKIFRFDSIERNKLIPDYSGNSHITEPLRVTIPVSQIPTSNSIGLEYLQLSINHPRISDIKVVLISPKGTEVWIVNRNGKQGSNYSETIFRHNGFNGPVSEGTPPFTGEYIPEGVLGHMNDGQKLNGKWILEIYDLEKGIQGQFNSVSLFFSENPAKVSSTPCNLYRPSKCICTNKNGDLLPDLSIIGDYTFRNFTEYPPTLEKVGEIHFGVAVVNIGEGPLEIKASNRWYCHGVEVQDFQRRCDDSTMPRQQMTQTIYQLKKGKLSSWKRNSSSIYYDERPGHEHFHAEDFVTYKLLQPDEQEKDFRKWKVLSEGVKASFCIWNLSYCREDIQNCNDVSGKNYTPETIRNFGLGGKYRSCDEKFQGLSVGGIDSYGEDYEGQTILLPADIKNGKYVLLLEVDRNNDYLESNDMNNYYLFTFFLTKQN